MKHGRHFSHSQEFCNRIAYLRSQGLAWSIISKRTGLSSGTCQNLAKRAR